MTEDEMMDEKMANAEAKKKIEDTLANLVGFAKTHKTELIQISVAKDGYAIAAVIGGNTGDINITYSIKEER